MRAKTSAEPTATWVRVRLTTPTDAQGTALTDGDLVLRADRVAADESDLLFFVADEEVFRLERRYFRALTWFVDRPTFGEWLRARRAQYTNSHRRWFPAELGQLAAEVAENVPWPEIAKRHGRTPAACRAAAVRLNPTTEGA